MAGELSTPILSDALVILGSAGIVIPLFARFRITPIIGFVLVGILVGPYGLGKLAGAHPWLAHVTIPDQAGRSNFAQFGMILLLFSGGLALSFDRLWTMRRTVFGLGALELLGNSALLTIGTIALGHSLAASIALGIALAMSSTALVMRIVHARTPVGKAAFAMLLFEDIALVPVIFVLDALAPFARSGDGAVLVQTILFGLFSILALLVAGRFLLPQLFALAARTKSSELFLATSLLVVIVAALATSAAGLSSWVGALIAGLLIAETDYHTEVEAILAPFKGLATGIFLIAVGMDIDLFAGGRLIGEVIAATAAVLALKALVTSLLLRLMGARPGTSAEAGILMASPSETTLIVLSAAAAARLIDADTARFWAVVTALGLIVTPALAWIGNRLGTRVEPLAEIYHPEDDPEARHAILIGFGRVGRLVADMLTAHGKSYVAVDSDLELVEAGKQAGYNAVFGDATHANAMELLGADHASAAILTMDDPVLAQRMVKRLRTSHGQLPIIVRARDAGHAAQLYKAGASHAVPETLESSLQLSEAVLVDLGVPMGLVIASIHEKRDELRAQIMEEGELDEKPRLKSSSLRDRHA